MLRLMEIAVGDERKFRACDRREEIEAAGDLPQIDELADLLAPVPEIERVREPLRLFVRMAGDDDAAQALRALQHLLDRAVRGDELVDAEGENVRGLVAAETVLRQLEAGDDDHPVLIERALLLTFDL